MGVDCTYRTVRYVVLHRQYEHCTGPCPWCPGRSVDLFQEEELGLWRVVARGPPHYSYRYTLTARDTRQNVVNETFTLIY
jgi:hypothetical protein